MEPIAIITARGGSKRIANKNTRLFRSKPMLAWPIEVAIASKIFSRVIISTEDPKIADLAKASGAEQLFVRPPELADDYATTFDVLEHAIEFLSKHSELPEHACCLYGTSAFITTNMLQNAYDLLCSTDADIVLAVNEFPHPPQRALKLQPDGMAEYVCPDCVPCRTQDLPKLYHDIGLFYFFKTNIFMGEEQPKLVDLKKQILIVPRHCALDIDTEDDWAYAEKIAILTRLGSELPD